MPDLSTAPTCVDLFAGCGGLTEGFLAAGIDVVASVELHPQAALTHAFNHPSTSVFVGDVRDWDRELLDDSLAEREVVRPDIVAGGPPCQGFSSAGKKSSTDPRNSLFHAFADVVAHYLPKLFLLENVPGFRTMYGGSTYNEAVATFANLGYQTTAIDVRAANYGVPQTRRRFVLVGWLAGEVEPFELVNGTTEMVTVDDALADLDYLRPGYVAHRHTSRSSLSEFALNRRANTELLFNHLASQHRERAERIMSQIAPGRSIRDVDPSLRSAKRTMSRLSRHHLSNTVLSLPDDMIHYKHNRILSVREAARLQTFDDDFVFFGKRTSGFVERRVDVPQYTQVGNAVPPLLADALGRSLVRTLGFQGLPDRRDLGVRRQRHEMVLGSPGWSGYTLHPDIDDTLALRTVRGAQIELPVSRDDRPISDQRPVHKWVGTPAPKRRKWAPGVAPKTRPSWQEDAESRYRGSELSSAS
jgi:DNA (cytosine-5)-methyltransferase 1